MTHIKHKKQTLLRAAMGTALVGTSLSQLALPVLAAGTQAGKTISNTATATYNDPGDPTTKTTTSNKVDVTVAEVAGLTNVAGTPIDTNGGSVIPGDTVQFPFLITNTGNSPTGIYIPTSNVTATNVDPATIRILIDINGDGTPEYILNKADNKLYVAGAATGGVYALGAAVAGDEVANVIVKDGTGYKILDDVNTGTPDGSGILADKRITVTVQGNVASGLVSGANVSAQLGNTGSNNASNADSQNQPDTADATNANEVRTVDIAGATAPETAGAPVNGEREAADTSTSLVVGQIAPKPLALATVSKVASNTNPGTTPADFTDDVITYDLSMKVANNLPLNFTGYDPAPLTGTTLKDGAGTDYANKYILVSDAKPTNATFTARKPLAPAGWEVVYTTDPVATTPTNAKWVKWDTTAPTATAGLLNTVTRIGFVYNTDTRGALAQGTTVSGFQLYATATGVTAATVPVYNLAQLFGSTPGGPTNNIIFDESGDQNPNNFVPDGNGGLTSPADNNGTAGDEAYGDYNPTATTGNTGDPGTPADADADTGNNNTGSGTDGEPNKLLLNTPPTPPAPGNLFIGPNGNAQATGAIGVNDDFTNKSIAEGVSTTDLTVNPAEVSFTNTVRNTSGVDLNNVIVLPISPFLANQVCTNCDYEETTLPNGTLVTIGTVQYQWYANIDNGAGKPKGAFGTPGQSAAETVFANLTQPAPVKLPTLAGGAVTNYTVKVDLPASTSTFSGYSIPVVAFVNNDGNESTFDPTKELINNITIDRLYTGYIKLLKEARIIRPDGTTTPWSSAPNAGNVSPGDAIQYRITYSNVSAAASANGTSTDVLKATNLKITEDGLVGGAAGNNWALDTDNNGIIDTSNKLGTAVVSKGTIEYYNGDPAVLGVERSGTTAASDVTKYINNVGDLVPGETGTFTFQRIMN